VEHPCTNEKHRGLELYCVKCIQALEQRVVELEERESKFNLDMATLECKYHERGKALEALKVLAVKGGVR